MKQQTIVVIAAIAFTLFIGMIIFRANTGQSLLTVSVHSIPMFDKLCHAVLCGTLAFLLNLATKNRLVKFWNRKWLVMSLALTVLFTIEEFSQIFLVNRNFDLLDLLANYVGIGLASGLIFYLNHLSSSSSIARKYNSIFASRES